MGAETSILEGCEWEDTFTDGLWAISHGKLDDDTEVSRFVVAKKDRNHQDILRNLIKNLRTIRHPSVLTYICSEEGSDGLTLVTEKAVPLESVLPSLSSTEICAGLHTVLEALQFLHENVGASHNNIHIGAVYVAGDGSWRLGGLEYLCKFSEATDAFCESSKAYRHESTITPEEKQGKVSTDATLGHARDVYAFAVMTESLLEHMQDLRDLTKTFELRIQDECLHSNPSNRPKVSSLLTDRLFNTTFLEIALFLKNITLKNEEERNIFFKNLLQKLHSLPEELVARRLVPGLLSRFVFMDQSAVENVLPSLLTPRKDMQGDSPQPGAVQPLLSEMLFKKYVVPKLVKIFSVHDYHIHILLLQYFHHFVHLIDKEDLEFDVFPQVLLGLRDSSEQIASLSLHGLAEMVPILGRDVVIGGKSKQYFKEGRPKTVNQDMLATMNNKQSNVHGVLGKMKLIDLAKQSEKGVSSTKEKDEAADRKWKEREQKREEMRRKREERKLNREKSKKIQDKKTVVEIPAEESEAKIQHSLAIQSQNISDKTESITSHSIASESLNTSNTSDDRVGDLSDTDNDVIKDSTNTDWSRRNDVAEEETADWSGWSEEEEQQLDFSEEIEKELATMDLEANSVASQNGDQKALTDFKGKAMKLVTAKHKQAMSIGDNKVNGAEPVDGIKSVTVSSPRNVNANSQKKLGSEFDIMNLDIKVNKEEDPFDYFADMIPKIEKSKPVLLDTSAGDNLSGNLDLIEGQKKFNLDVQDTNIVDGDGGGWGDDDW